MRAPLQVILAHVCAKPVLRVRLTPGPPPGILAASPTNGCIVSVLQPGFLGYELTKVFILYTVAFLSGLLVVHHGVRVNYTRKINHFALFFVPMFLASYFPYEQSLATVATTGGVLMTALGLYVEPVRSRVPVVATMFASFDRPEDRPYTMLWLLTQIAAGYAVIIPLAVLFAQRGTAELMLIPILINGIGDGLAEPVGVRFGRHTYRVRALHGDRVYTRSLEGSACVFITGIAAVLLFHGSFTTPQFYAALATIPLAMTLAEAFSPHTWDTPFLFLTGGVLLLGITAVL
jgi:dolichol kinase